MDVLTDSKSLLKYNKRENPYDCHKMFFLLFYIRVYICVCHYPLFNFIGLRIICNYFRLLSSCVNIHMLYPHIAYALNFAFHVKMYPGNENLSILRKSSNYSDARYIRVTGYQYLESKFIAPPPKVKLKYPLATKFLKRILHTIIKMRSKKIKREFQYNMFQYKKCRDLV